MSLYKTFIIAKQVSMPIKSANCSGPIGTFVPFFIIPSISSFLPTPVSRQIIASLIYGIKILFAKNPGESVETEEILPMRVQKSMAVWRVASEVCKPEMISTPFWIGTGFMKWVETTREEAEVSVGFSVVAAAILVIEMEEVLVAKIAWLGAI